MMRSLFSGVSGLKNHQTRMDVIGNNISNVNTTGFKSSRVNFTDMLSQNLSGASSPQDGVGGTNPKQIGLGSAVGAVDLLFTNGSVQSTGVNTDLALSGSNTLFIVDRGGGTNNNAYTRNGDFQFDAEGNYVQAGTGYYVQGWTNPGDSDTVPTNGPVGRIQIDANATMAPVASQRATYTNNLNAEVLTVKSISGGTNPVEETKNYSATENAGQSATATKKYPVTITTADGGSIAPQGTYFKPKEGTFKVGDTYKITTKTNGEAVTVKDTNTVVVSLDGGGTATAELSGTSTKWTFNGVPGIVDGTSHTQNATLFSVAGMIETPVGNKTVTAITLSSEITGMQQGYLKEATATADNAVTLVMSDGSTMTQTSGKFEVGHSLPIVTTLSVYDTLGSVHEVPVYFTLVSAEDDLWEVSVTTDGKNTTSWEEPDGSITTVTMDPLPLQFDTHGSHPEGSGLTTLSLTNGSQATQAVQLDFSNMTQYSSSSTVAGKADGNAAGSLVSISIDRSGTITGTYSNGMKRAEAQVAVAQFTNPGGLTKAGESLYEKSNNSGLPNVGTAASFGATITPSALEMSNVDVANEFTDMIVTQRGFQSNSKIITVSDEMLETVVNMKR